MLIMVEWFYWDIFCPINLKSNLGSVHCQFVVWTSCKGASAGVGASAVSRVHCGVCRVQCAACHKWRFRNSNRMSQTKIILGNYFKKQ